MYRVRSLQPVKVGATSVWCLGDQCNKAMLASRPTSDRLAPVIVQVRTPTFCIAAARRLVLRMHVDALSCKGSGKDHPMIPAECMHIRRQRISFDEKRLSLRMAHAHIYRPS